MDKCDPARPLGPWLRGIAVNLLANHRRKFRALPIGLNEDLQDLVDAELAQRFETVGEGVALEALHECLEGVDGSSRRLLQARYNDCLSLEDLAATLNRKVSAVSMQLHRLRVVLGDCIESKIRESSRSSEAT
jgi:RNA polymerase sigma-70 factor (ECF subfamily)